ncbi:MAG TPA: RagB/SusD family nutrient uptake outer membrane protein, partial [Longimicrobiales bacterium]|nr:RagB/SusD family nutrient uptake outer membrane protein [Longimicrobiales bacterium]
IMRKYSLMSKRLFTVALGAVVMAACDLDVTNPNQPTEEQILSNSEGLIALGVGLQGQFAQSIDDYVIPPALVTDEWGTKTRALLSYQSLLTGLSFENTYDIVANPYANTYQTVRTANTMLTALPGSGFTGAFAAGYSALAKTYKAMALGYASLIFEKLPVNAEAAGGVPKPRAEVQDSVLALLLSARTELQAVTDGELATFNARLLPVTGFNLRNVINAMIARYSLFRGLNQQANDAAALVPATSLSTLNYPAPTVNPVQNLGFGLIYIGGLRSWVTAAEAGDRRPNYWLNTTAATFTGTPDSTMYDFRKYTGVNDPFPIYLPDEMKLIRAEAQARLGSLTNAIDLINQVRTQATSTIDEPVAGLPALTAAQLPDLNAVLRQIAIERRYELYMQGLRWEDIRRLGTAASAVTFTFLPLPAVECRANPNAGCS